MKPVRHLCAFALVAALMAAACMAPSAEPAEPTGVAASRTAIGLGPGSPVQIFMGDNATNAGRPWAGRTIAALVRNTSDGDMTADLLFVDNSPGYPAVQLDGVPHLISVAVSAIHSAHPEIDPASIEADLGAALGSTTWYYPAFELHSYNQLPPL